MFGDIGIQHANLSLGEGWPQAAFSLERDQHCDEFIQAVVMDMRKVMGV